MEGGREGGEGGREGVMQADRQGKRGEEGEKKLRLDTGAVRQNGHKIMDAG